MAPSPQWPSASGNAPLLFERLSLLIRPRKRTTPDEWGASNREYPPSSGFPGKRDPYLTPYAIPFGRAVAARRHPRCVFVISAQSGKSETLLDIIGQRLDQQPAPILYVGPTRKFIEEQWEPRVMALLDEAPTLASKVARGKRMTKTRKVIAGVPLRLAHAGSSTALKSDPASLALTDEADEMMANVKGQGNPLALIDRRGETHADFVHAIVSTPSEGRAETETDPVSGLVLWSPRNLKTVVSTVWRLFLQGTRHHWCWPCPHCGEYFVPRLACLEIPEVEITGPDGKPAKRAATPIEARTTAFIRCPRCSGEITDAHKPGIAKRGVEVAPGQRVLRDGTVEGEPPESTTYSLWTSGLCSPFKTIGERAAQYVEALETGQHDQIQAVVNGAFGEPYAVAPLNSLKWESLRDKALPYRLGEVPREVIRLVAGVDVQKRSLYFVIRGFGARGSSWLVDAGQLHGSTADDEVWDALTETLTATYGGLTVDLALIDSGFRPNKVEAGDEHRVYEYCRQMPWLVKPTKGRATQSKPLNVKTHEVRTDGKAPSYSLELVTVDSDHFKSLVTSRLVTPFDRPGSINVPSNVGEDYYRQLASEVREIVDGRPVWTQVSPDNHYLDCEALAAAAGRLLNVERIPVDLVRDWDETAVQTLGLPPPADEATATQVEPTASAAPVSPAAAAPVAPKPAASVRATPAPPPKSFRDSLKARMADRAGRFNNR